LRSCREPEQGEGVLAYLYYERTRTIAKIDVPGVSGEITKKGVDIEIGKPKK
jgi:predicted GNAT family acetyltransferase